VMRLDSKVARAANGSPVDEFGGDVLAIITEAERFGKAGTARRSPSRPRQMTPGLVWPLQKFKDIASRRLVEIGAELGETQEGVSEKLIAAMEPTLRRHGQQLVSFELDRFDECFGTVVAHGNCGPHSKFYRKATALRRYQCVRQHCAVTGIGVSCWV